MSSPSEPRIVRGACPHDCPDTCATLTTVVDGRAVQFIADPSHPITQGWLCAKVRPYLDRVYHPDRLLHPLRRTGAKGEGGWERISWDEAIAEITERWNGIIAEDGPSAILPYSYSGTLGLVDNIVANTRLWQRMGASGLVRSICDAASVEAVNATVGGRYAPDPRDVAASKLVILWGNNPASTNPHFVPLLREAQRNGTYVVVIDPRRTTTARSADLFIQPRPGTDGALAMALAHVLFRDGLADEAWLAEHSIGWEAYRDRVAAWTPERAAGITGVSVEAIEALARRYGTTKPALLKFADGINRHQNGGQTVRTLSVLPALVGQFGVRGGGLFYSQSGHVVWDWEAISHASECPPTPRMVNMNRIGAALTGEVDDPPIRALYVAGANPVTSSPNAALTIRGLLRDDLFTVVHEQFMTDTARYADIVLPAASQLERIDLHKPYGHRHLQYNDRAIDPPGEARSDWDVQRALAAAMGYDEPWFQQSHDEVIREVLDATREGNPRLTGITLERLKAEGTVPYHFEAHNWVPFSNLMFPTPSGRVEIWSEAMAEQGVDPLPDFVPAAEIAAAGAGDLVLLTGAAHHFVSSSFANQASLLRKEGTPWIELHPDDAASRGISDGDTVVVENSRGSCMLRAMVTTDVQPGVAVAAKGFWGTLSPDGRNVNWLTSDALADLGGQATFHSNVVTVRPVAPDEIPDAVTSLARSAD